MADININLGIFAVAAGTPDVITATYTPAPASLYNGLVLFFRASGANTSTTPTFKPNTLAAKTVVKEGNQALVAGDIVGDHALIYNSTLEKWILLNPASDESDTFWEAGAGSDSLKDKRSAESSGDGGFSAGADAINSGANGQSIGVSSINSAAEGQAIGHEAHNDFDRSTALGHQSTTTAVDQTNISKTVRLQAYTGSGTRYLRIDANGIVSAVTDVEVIAISCSDLTTNLATGTSKGYLRMPFAMTLTAVRASVIDAPTGSTLIVDINEAGSTILSTKLTIDASEKTSTTAATPPVISDTALADDAEITVDIDQVGSTNTGKGLIVYLIGTRT